MNTQSGQKMERNKWKKKRNTAGLFNRTFANHFDLTEWQHNPCCSRFATISFTVLSHLFDGYFGPQPRNSRHLFYLSSLCAFSLHAAICSLDPYVAFFHSVRETENWTRRSRRAFSIRSTWPNHQSTKLDPDWFIFLWTRTPYWGLNIYVAHAVTTSNSRVLEKNRWSKISKERIRTQTACLTGLQQNSSLQHSTRPFKVIEISGGFSPAWTAQILETNVVKFILPWAACLLHRPSCKTFRIMLWGSQVVIRLLLLCSFSYLICLLPLTGPFCPLCLLF